MCRTRCRRRAGTAGHENLGEPHRGKGTHHIQLTLGAACSASSWVAYISAETDTHTRNPPLPQRRLLGLVACQGTSPCARQARLANRGAAQAHRDGARWRDNTTDSPGMCNDKHGALLAREPLFPSGLSQRRLASVATNVHTLPAKDHATRLGEWRRISPNCFSSFPSASFSGSLVPCRLPNLTQCQTRRRPSSKNMPRQRTVDSPVAAPHIYPIQEGK